MRHAFPAEARPRTARARASEHQFYDGGRQVITDARLPDALPVRVSAPPAAPKIYHITHVTNLESIVASGFVHADATMALGGGPPVSIGMAHIKQDRFNRPVSCHPGDMVAEYVPYNFCSRSVMLYLIYMANHPQLTYRDGQGPIVHLRADLNTVVEWASRGQVRWAFTAANARAGYAEFWADVADLQRVPWDAVASTDFRDSAVKEGKQAEFLMHERFPWELVEAVGVQNQQVREQAEAAIGNGPHRPPVTIEPTWYY